MYACMYLFAIGHKNGIIYIYISLLKAVLIEIMSVM